MKSSNAPPILRDLCLPWPSASSIASAADTRALPGLGACLDNPGGIVPAAFQQLCCLCYRNESTFARLADPLGFVPAEDIFHVVKAIVATQRDYGRRDDRKQARLKYLVNEWGLDKFRGVVEQYYGKKLQPFR